MMQTALGTSRLPRKQAQGAYSREVRDGSPIRTAPGKQGMFVHPVPDKNQELRAIPVPPNSQSRVKWM